MLRRKATIILILASFCAGASDIVTIRKILKDWCEAHNEWKLDKIRLLYAKSVLYYTQWVDIEVLIRDKSSYFRPDDAFALKIVSDLTLTEFSPGITKCDFIKEVYHKGKVNRYPAYLLFKTGTLDTEILVESDEITDKNLGFHLTQASIEESKKGITDNEKQNGDEQHGYYYAVSLLSLLAVGGFMTYRRVFRDKKKAVASNNENSNPDRPAAMTEAVETPAGIRDTTGFGNVYKGREFENFVAGKFDQNYFKIKEWTGDKSVKGIIPKSNQNPDLVLNFEFRGFEKEFAVECKWRKEIKGVLRLYRDQLDRYRNFGIKRNLDVYLALGIGGTPIDPAELFIFRLDEIV